MNKLSKEQQIIIGCLVGFVFVIYAYWNYFMKPILGDIQTKQTKLESLESQVEQAERQAKRLPLLKSELEKLETELSLLEKQLPTAKDIPGIIRIITREANAQNISFVSMRPLDARRDQYFDVLSFELSMTATLHNFAHFLASLGQQERIFQVEQVKLSGGGQPSKGGGSPSLNVNFTLKTYAYAG